MTSKTTAQAAAKASQESVEKAVKAGQATAEKAVKAGKQAAEKALKAGSEQVTKAYDQAVAATKEQVQKTFPQAVENFERVAGFQKSNIEAFFAGCSSAIKGAETLSDEMLAFNKKAMDEGFAAAQKMFDCKTVQDVIELQGELARGQFESMLQQGSKFSELAMKVAGEISEPMQAQFGKAMEQIAKPAAA